MIKLKRYGKNQRALKKLLADTETKIFKNGNDWTRVFKSLIGYDFNFYLTQKGLEITDITGDTFILKTNLELEVI